MSAYTRASGVEVPYRGPGQEGKPSLIRIETHSPEESLALGVRIGRAARAGTLIAFRGGLGAGKTTLAKGIAFGLGIEEEVTSPTYTLVSEYRGRLPLRHVDAYRLSSAQDFEDIGGRDHMAQDGLCLIEWSENVQAALPPEAVTIEICAGAGPDDRVFELSGSALEDFLL